MKYSVIFFVVAFAVLASVDGKSLFSKVAEKTKQWASKKFFKITDKVNGKVEAIRTDYKNQIGKNALAKLADDAKKLNERLTKKFKAAKAKMPERMMSDPCMFYTELSLIAGKDVNQRATINFNIRRNVSDRECNMAKTWVKLFNKTSDDLADFAGLAQLCPVHNGCDLKVEAFTANASLPLMAGQGANLTTTANYSGDCQVSSDFKQVVEVKRCSDKVNDLVYHLPNSCPSRDFCASALDPDRPTTVQPGPGGNGGGNSTTVQPGPGGNGGGNSTTVQPGPGGNGGGNSTTGQPGPGGNGGGI